ncbi:MAG: YgfZ/GcvT domain-containing protein [Gammaproteobacteria bacterium]
MTSPTEIPALKAVRLDDYRVLSISGDERVDFLQGQLTQDVMRIDPDHGALAGWATAKGRLLAVGQLIATPDALLWPLPASIVDGVQRRLGMFLLRANAAIVVTDHSVLGLCGLDAEADVSIGPLRLPAEPGATAHDGDLIAARLVGDPARAIVLGPADAVSELSLDDRFAGADENDWCLQDIRAGLPTVVAATSEAFVPQMVNLDLLDGISFTKGCYVGQEIVARTQNLGRIKRRMYGFRQEQPPAVAPGDTLYGPDHATGKVVMTARDGEALELTAVIPIEHSAAAWFADEARASRLTALSPPYSIPAPAG